MKTNVNELPAYYEDEKVIAWRNSWAHRAMGYPYIQYIIRLPTGDVTLEARKKTDLEKFNKLFYELYKKEHVRTFWSLAKTVMTRGERGLLEGTYIDWMEDAVLVLDPMVGKNLDFIIRIGRDELWLTVPRDLRLWEVFYLLKKISKGGEND